MNYPRTCVVLALMLVSCSLSARAASQAEPSDIDSANRLFEAGKFADAGELYARIVAQDPKNYSATLQLGRIALLANRLDDAQTWLAKAIGLHPDDADAKVMLAEAFYRRDDFQKAAACAERRRRQHQPAGYPAISDFECRDVRELQGSDAL